MDKISPEEKIQWMKKLWAIPGIGLKVINDVEHVFATINSHEN